MGEKRGAYKILADKREGNAPLATGTLWGENNIKTNLQEIEGGG
jgi:hypothetical protein